MIGGAALGAFVVGNTGEGAQGDAQGAADRCFKGSKYTKACTWS